MRTLIKGRYTQPFAAHFLQSSTPLPLQKVHLWYPLSSLSSSSVIFVASNFLKTVRREWPTPLHFWHVRIPVRWHTSQSCLKMWGLNSLAIFTALIQKPTCKKKKEDVSDGLAAIGFGHPGDRV